MVTSDPVGCLGNFLFFSVPIEQFVRQLEIPFSKKISLLHSHVLFLLCVELTLVLVMGYCLGFIFVVSITKHLPCHLFYFLENQWFERFSSFSQTLRYAGVLPFNPIKCYRWCGCGNSRVG